MRRRARGWPTGSSTRARRTGTRSSSRSCWRCGWSRRSRRRSSTSTNTARGTRRRSSRATSMPRGRSSAGWMRRACTSTPRRASPTAASSGWARRSATRRRSCTPAARSGCASCARSSTSSRATGTYARSGLARIGILGGTFNPPHLAHLICAQEALTQLELERVVLMPVNVPPHKEAAEDPGASHRAEMCRLATAKDDRLAVSTLELDREGPSYTVDTLRAIHASAPGDDLTFIVGGDMAYSLPTWREPESVLELATLAVAERSGTRRGDIEQRLAELGGRERVRFFDMPRVDISSSDIRHRVREGRPIRYLVPEEVVQYIGAQGLYRAEVAA